MSTNPFGLCVIALALCAPFMPYRYALYLVLGVTPLGAAAVFNMPSMGGGSIVAANFCLVFLAIRVFLFAGPEPIVRSVLPPSAGFWYLALTIYAILAGVFLPEVLSGITETMMVSRLPGGMSRVIPQALHFTPGNINQIIYAIGGLGAFAASFAMISKPKTRSAFVTAILVASIVNITLAVLDLATFATGTGELMDFVRTANYSMLTGAELGGIKRITGAFPEASSFSTYTLVLFATTASLWLDRIRPLATGIAAASLLVSVMLATSATGYLGLAIIFGVFAAYTLTRPLFGKPIRQPVMVLALMVAAIGAFAAILLFVPQVGDALADFFDEAVLGKLHNESGRVRGMWNAVAFDNFIDSMGIGVGIGSARASSYALVLLSNVGIPGTLLFLIFVAQLFFAKSPDTVSSDDVKLLRALRSGLTASLAAAAIVVTTFDLGVLTYIICGAIAGIACPTGVPQSRPSLAGHLRSQKAIS